MLLYEMVSGQLPFYDEQPVLVLGKHLKEKPPPIPVPVPDELARLIDALLAKDPKKRPASAAEVGRVLASLGSGVHALRRVPGRRSAPAWIGTVLGLGGLALLGSAVAAWAWLSEPALEAKSIAPKSVEADVGAAVVAEENREEPATEPESLAPPASDAPREAAAAAEPSEAAREEPPRRGRRMQGERTHPRRGGRGRRGDRGRGGLVREYY